MIGLTLASHLFRSGCTDWPAPNEENSDGEVRSSRPPISPRNCHRLLGCLIGENGFIADSDRWNDVRHYVQCDVHHSRCPNSQCLNTRRRVPVEMCPSSRGAKIRSGNQCPSQKSDAFKLRPDCHGTIFLYPSLMSFSRIWQTDSLAITLLSICHSCEHSTPTRKFQNALKKSIWRCFDCIGFLRLL